MRGHCSLWQWRKKQSRLFNLKFLSLSLGEGKEGWKMKFISWGWTFSCIFPPCLSTLGLWAEVGVLTVLQ